MTKGTRFGGAGRGCGASLLALGAKAKELQLVCHHLETAFTGDLGFPFQGEAVLDRMDGIAGRADEVMVVSRMSGARHFETRRPVAEIEPLDEPHVLEQMEGPIDGGEVAFAGREGFEDLLVGHGPRVGLENSKDGLPRSGDSPGAASETLGQVAEFWAVMVAAGVVFHAEPSRFRETGESRPATSATKKRPMLTRTMAGPHGTSAEYETVTPPAPAIMPNRTAIQISCLRL